MTLRSFAIHTKKFFLYFFAEHVQRDKVVTSLLVVIDSGILENELATGKKVTSDDKLLEKYLKTIVLISSHIKYK